MREAFKRAGINPPPEPTPQKGMALPEDYVAKAESVMKKLKEASNLNYRDRDYYNYNSLTTSKIRNILSMTSELYNEAILDKSEKLTKKMQDSLSYLKVRLIYECGREPKIVKPFVEKADLLEIIDEIGESKERFIKFSRYMEALVAYHRYFGGDDK